MDLRHISGRIPSIPTLQLHVPRVSSYTTSSAINPQPIPDSDGSRSHTRMFVLGLGFVAQFFGQDLKNHGWVVSGTCTGIMKKKKLEDMGFIAYLFDANEPEPTILDALRYNTHLLVSIPPVVGIGDPILRCEILRNGLFHGNLEWLGYLSSTSVYGNCGGAWVGEDYDTNPTTESAKARLAAEEGWLSLGHDLGISTQIFRLGGIYGPGRSAIDTLIKQQPLSDSKKMRVSRNYTSRVHVADICQALKASIRNIPSFPRVYNVVDDEPAPREEVFGFAQELVEKKWPGYLHKSTSSSETSSVPKGRMGEKRVSNARVKKELGVKLIHPSYKSGLQSIIDNMDQPISR